MNTAKPKLHSCFRLLFQNVQRYVSEFLYETGNQASRPLDILEGNYLHGCMHIPQRNTNDTCRYTLPIERDIISISTGPTRHRFDLIGYL